MIIAIIEGFVMAANRIFSSRKTHFTVTQSLLADNNIYYKNFKNSTEDSNHESETINNNMKNLQEHRTRIRYEKWLR